MMKNERFRILVITPVRHIAGVPEALESAGDVTYKDDPTEDWVVSEISHYDAIFTNPNKSKVFLGKRVLDAAKNLKVISTASTGTNHIDKDYAHELKLPVLALTEERQVISKISSTAELAFALTLAGLRHVVQSHNGALTGEWDYTKYIGRQLNHMVVGVIGYGRLGAMYANYCRAFGAKVLVYDPYKVVNDIAIEQLKDIDQLLLESDVISLHTHVTDNTRGMIDINALSKVKKDVLIVNTSRGEVIVESDLVDFLKKNPGAKVATDVLADEVRNRQQSPLLRYAQENHQVTVTQHIGGMCKEAQEIAYGHAATMLRRFLCDFKSKC